MRHVVGRSQECTTSTAKYQQIKHKQSGTAALTGVVRGVLLDKLQRDEARSEFVSLNGLNLHLAGLAGVA